MRELVLELMGEYGNLAVFLLILVENLCPPIPSEVILTFGGCYDSLYGYDTGKRDLFCDGRVAGGSGDPLRCGKISAG